MSAAETVELTPPASPLRGRVVLPGSKSITNRALLLAALARGTSRLTGALKSDDTRWMAQALRAMGVGVEEPDATSFVVTGSGRLRAPGEPLFLGNAGTAVRFLTAAAALADGPVTIDGDEHMRKRPIGALLDALRELGIEAQAPTGSPPVIVAGKGGFAGGRTTIDASLTSQYVSALLMLGPCGRAGSEVALKNADIGARGYVDLTLAAMRAFGSVVEPAAGDAAWRIAPTGYCATDFAIEPDASAATYLWAAQLLTGGQIDLGLAPERFTQPDAAAWPLIAAFPHMPAMIDGSQMQDAVPTLAALAAFNDGAVRFTGIANMRVKECDRIAALAAGLSAVKPGLGVDDGDDLMVAGDPSLAGTTVSARLDVRADHRMAMAFALLGLKMGGIRIEDPACTAKTYPAFWEALGSLGVQMRFETLSDFDGTSKPDKKGL